MIDIKDLGFPIADIVSPSVAFVVYINQVDLQQVFALVAMGLESTFSLLQNIFILHPHFQTSGAQRAPEPNTYYSGGCTNMVTSLQFWVWYSPKRNGVTHVFGFYSF